MQLKNKYLKSFLLSKLKLLELFDYQPQMVDELKLTKGDLVRLLEDVEDG